MDEISSPLIYAVVIVAKVNGTWWRAIMWVLVQIPELEYEIAQKHSVRSRLSVMTTPPLPDAARSSSAETYRSGLKESISLGRGADIVRP